jgi:hypothetical protein
MKMGKDTPIQGDTPKMKVFFNKAIQFQPGLKKEIAEYPFARRNEILEGIAQNAESRTSETLLIV